MMKLKTIMTVLLLTTIFFTSCEKEDPPIPNEEEVITTLTYTLTPDGGGDEVVMSFKDLDGDGGNDPSITGGTLAANTSYTGSLVLLNEQESPSENITEEVEEEGDEHQFFFTTTIAGLTVAYNDKDANDNPLGINTKVNTAGVGTGTLNIILRHEPAKTAEGVVGGDITNAGGETDIEVTFNVNVE